MIKRLLIANRGEIARRIIESCNRLGIETVLAVSEADQNTMPAQLADYVICIGPAPSAASYLNVDAIVNAALETGAQAIHPGYGFLAENAQLSQRCHEEGLIFIGPTPGQLDAVGDKLKARETAVAAGLPVIPGGPAETLAEAQALAKKIAYHLLVKAVSGGGGRGMKLLEEPSQLESTLEIAMSEAQAAFGDARIYLEHYVASGRHIEVQILGDGNNVIHFGERDCSIQRRYQKLLEEAPAPHLNSALRQQMHEAAVAFAKHLNYRGLGTVELLVDTQKNTFYFLEMNARIQVEHPVTEALCGVDLVAEQIAVAQGQLLTLKQSDVQLQGHAIECRINAENWHDNFRPCPGTVERAQFPIGPGIRIDTHIQSGTSITPYYDSLLAKLIVHGDNRAQAIKRLRKALKALNIQGIDTTASLHLAFMDDPEFNEGGFDTGFFLRFLERQQQTKQSPLKEPS